MVSLLYKILSLLCTRNLAGNTAESSGGVKVNMTVALEIREIRLLH